MTVLLDDEAERAQAAATLLSGMPGLPPAALVRLSVLDPERPAPAAGPEEAAAWARELAGPFGELARDALERAGADHLRAVAGDFGGLDPADAAWLLGRADADLAAELADRAAGSDDPELQLAALRAAPAAVAPERLAELAGGGAVEVRAAAVAAGAPVDLERLLGGGEREPEVLAAAVTRYAREQGAGAAEALAALMGGEDWRVRAAARDGAVAAGDSALEPLRALVRHDREEVRAGAVRALLDLGDDEWLEREVLG